MLDCHRSLRNTAASYGPERPEAVRHFLRALIERSLSAGALSSRTAFVKLNGHAQLLPPPRTSC